MTHKDFIGAVWDAAGYTGCPLDDEQETAEIADLNARTRQLELDVDLIKARVEAIEKSIPRNRR